MYLLIIFLPLLSSILSVFPIKFVGRYGSAFITIFCMLLSAVLSLFIFFEVVLSQTVCVVTLFRWIDVGTLCVYWEFLFDSLTSIMLLVVIIVSLCVHIYSLEYMGHDPHLGRFMSYLSLFTFFMILLVTAGNLLQLFLGWEGVGFCSYLLINFWFTRILANKSAMKALIINKIGDVSLLLGIIIIFLLFNSLDFSFINCSIWLLQDYHYLDIKINFLNISIDVLSLAVIFIIIGAAAKSAQIGLHTWLPDAMEGPTPVSALIHAATMVTAGVFLLLRCTYILKYTSFCLLIIIFLGGITAFVSATIGLFQNDIKKIIAYSTCSQLGYMVFSIGLSNYSSSLFHLMNHAFFKALLFMSAGAIIHSMLDQQDIRRMGNLIKFLPISYFMILVGSLALMGIPFLTGFYSKDFLIEWAFGSSVILNLFAYWLGVISAFLTTFYSIKLLYITFFNSHSSYKSLLYNKNHYVIKESGIFIIIPLMILFLGSVFVGYLFKDLFIGVGTDIWINSLDPENFYNVETLLRAEFLPVYIKIIPFIFTIISILLALFFFNYYLVIFNFIIRFFSLFSSKNRVLHLTQLNFLKKLVNINTFFNRAYFFNENYNSYLFKMRESGNVFFLNLDKGFIEWIGPISIVKTVNRFLSSVSKKHTGLVDHYIFLMVLGILGILVLFLSMVYIYAQLDLFILLLLLILFEIKNYNNKSNLFKYIRKFFK